ncbi:HMA2 domain-containing protein [Pseudodesulfovibrio piezophilus]|uniref:HMA domain-containing protein n=1 Tax=Pseudodesulfovibrio piezophilus (strain DSM 21447 / JCM 15486 / C1TLV30) TaxID=1322246 RepID=M1WKU0_PSEP2|nr:hypothetical protein [Pseudodesulfovibrio piezophilus]CCH50186.1 conserved protein of unknown function [Pseudodesulfovibrio piezophilus C1TLV30]
MNAVAEEGRIRFRNEALKVADFGYKVRDSLLEVKGVIQVQVNKRVGSILILFDKTKITAENILTKIAEGLGIDMNKVKANMASAQKTLNGRKARRYVKRGLAASLIAAIGIVYYSERWHVVAGSAFLSLLGMHIYQNRRTLAK